MSETDSGSPQIDSISICDVMRNNSSTFVKKVESQLPTYAQVYSDIYREYLHMVDDLSGTCYISEKEFFDKLNIDQSQLKVFDEYLRSLTNMYSSHIDFSTDFLRNYSAVRISMIKTYDISLILDKVALFSVLEIKIFAR